VADLMAAKVLRRAAELIDQGWIQGALAKDEQGHTVDCDDSSATRWCLVGALIRARYEIGANRTPILPGLNSDWNDKRGRTADEVAAALRRAADHAEGAA
jgi:hypothetical protein